MISWFHRFPGTWVIGIRFFYLRSAWHLGRFKSLVSARAHVTFQWKYPTPGQCSLLLDLPVGQVHHSRAGSTGSGGHSSRRSHSPTDDFFGWKLVSCLEFIGCQAERSFELEADCAHWQVGTETDCFASLRVECKRGGSISCCEKVILLVAKC